MAGRPDPKPARREKAPRKRLRTRPKPPAAAEEREARLAFKIRVLALDGGCIAHDNPADCDGDLDVFAHHAVTQQQLRNAGLDELRWDVRNGATLCYKAHRRHHSGVERLPLSRLPARCVAFARDYGFEAVLRRFYATA